jgi:hypothetical protein
MFFVKEAGTRNLFAAGHSTSKTRPGGAKRYPAGVASIE